jgi:cell division protein FtsB
MTARLRIPLISRFVATHYSYEALIVAQAKLNPLALRQDQLQQQIDRLVKQKNRNAKEAARLEDLKDTLAMVSGLESGSPRKSSAACAGWTK